jgi:hypothetical protein
MTNKLKLGEKTTNLEPLAQFADDGATREFDTI